MTYSMPFQQTEEGCRIEGEERWTMQDAGVTLGLQVTRPRAIPWLRIVRVPRFGRGLHGPAVREIGEHVVEDAMILFVSALFVGIPNP